MRLGRGSNEFLQASKQQNPRSKIDVTDGPTDIASYRVACARLKMAQLGSEIVQLGSELAQLGLEVAQSGLEMAKLRSEMASWVWKWPN